MKTRLQRRMKWPLTGISESSELSRGHKQAVFQHDMSILTKEEILGHSHRFYWSEVIRGTKSLNKMFVERTLLEQTGHSRQMDIFYYEPRRDQPTVLVIQRLSPCSYCCSACRITIHPQLCRNLSCVWLQQNSEVSA